MTASEEKLLLDALKTTVRFAYVVHDRGGRFGEDILAVRCKVCRKVTKDDQASDLEMQHTPTCIVGRALKLMHKEKMEPVVQGDFLSVNDGDDLDDLDDGDE